MTATRATSRSTSTLPNWVPTALRLSVGGAFVVASVLKLKDPSAFAEQIANYQFLPTLSNYLATSLPGIELTAALVLLLGKGPWRWAGSVTLLGLLTIFTASLVRAWALGINIECGCFGVGSTEIGIWPVLRNLSLMTALAVSLYLELGKTETQASIARST